MGAGAMTTEDTLLCLAVAQDHLERRSMRIMDRCSDWRRANCHAASICRNELETCPTVIATIENALFRAIADAMWLKRQPSRLLLARSRPNSIAALMSATDPKRTSRCDRGTRRMFSLPWDSRCYRSRWACSSLPTQSRVRRRQADHRGKRPAPAGRGRPGPARIVVAVRVRPNLVRNN